MSGFVSLLSLLSLNNDPGAKMLTISTGYDGVPITSDGSKSLWPIICYINELPAELRRKVTILSTLHSGDQKPKNIFIPLIDELVQLDLCPISVKVGDANIRFYVRLLNNIADAPARADSLNSKQHNSTFGCNCCYVMAVYKERAFRYPLTSTNKARTDAERYGVHILSWQNPFRILAFSHWQKPRILISLHSVFEEIRLSQSFRMFI